MDAAKNVTATFAQIPPPTVIITSPSGYTKNNRPLLQYTVSSGTEVVKVDDVVVSKVSGSYLDILPDGPHTVHIEATNTGITGFADSSFVVDTVAPVITVTGAIYGTTYTTDVTPHIEITDANLRNSSITLNGQPFVSSTTISANGQYTLVITADDSATNQSSKTITFSINKVSLSILDKGLNAGTANRPYSDKLTSIGGVGTLTWSATGLPTDISLNSSTGELSGTPKTVGNHFVDVTVNDSNTPPGTATARLELSVNDLDVQWSKTTSGDGARGRRVVVDRDGNIYTMGNAYNAALNKNDIVLSKYSPAGDQQWSNLFAGGDMNDAIDLVIDSSNNLYVLNNVYYLESGSGSQIFKFEPVYGNNTWTSPLYQNISGSALAIDSAGNFYLTDIYAGNLNVYKYDSSGAPVWNASSNSGGDESAAITLDSAGNIYVTGTIWSENSGSYLTVKFDANGSQQWARQYKFEAEDAESFGIAVDTAGNVYVTGNSYTDGHEMNVLTVKYDADGNKLWDKTYDRIGGSDRSEKIVLDGKGNFYLVGRSYYRTFDKSDYLVMKYDTNGNNLWSKTYSSQGTAEGWGDSIAIDTNDNLVITGWTNDSTVGIDQMTTVKFYRTDLTITTSGMPVAVVGGYPTGFHQPLTAINGTPPYTWSIIAGTLPPGLDLTNTWDYFDGSCQSIFGYPTETGQYPFTLQVTDSSNPVRTATRLFQINAYANVGIPTDLPGVIKNMPYSKVLQATGGVPPYTWSVGLSYLYPYIAGLPPGLSFNASTGIISGTATAEGSYSFVVYAVDSVGITGMNRYDLTVSNPVSVSTASLPVGVVSMPYINRNDASNPDIYLHSEGGTGCDWEGCSPRNIWSIAGGVLPTGMNLDTAGGRLSGTPTVAGTFDITFRVTDPASGSFGDKPLQLVIKTIDILDKGLAAGTLNKPYADTLSAGGTGTFTWSASNLPPGITLTGNVLGGTPTETGYFKPRITVTDASQNSAYKDLELSISDLDFQWERTVTGDGTRGKRVVTDRDGNIYTLGTSYNTTVGNNDIIFTKYSADGSQSGSTITIDNGDDEAVDMVIDSSNNIYVLSQYWDLNTGTIDHKIYKYAADGSSWTSTGSPGTSAETFAVDSQGNSFVATAFNIGSGWYVKVYKYNADGARVIDWEATYNNGDAYPRGIAVDNSGNVYVLAVATFTAEEGNNFLTVKFGPNGQLDTNWPRVHKSTESTDESPTAITVDGNNNVYVSGTFQRNHEAMAKTIKYDAAGNLVWLNIYSRMNRSDRLYGLLLDGKGNLYVVGSSSYRTNGKEESLIIKYAANTPDPDGKILWTKSFDYQGADDDRANSVAIDKNDNLVITGQAWNTTVGTDQMTTVKFDRTGLTITTSSLPAGIVGTSYSQQLAYGRPPYTLSITGGSLPGGLTLNTDTGAISGTPTAAGISNFTLEVQDQNGATANGTFSATISSSL